MVASAATALQVDERVLEVNGHWDVCWGRRAGRRRKEGALHLLQASPPCCCLLLKARCCIGAGVAVKPRQECNSNELCGVLAGRHTTRHSAMYTIEGVQSTTHPQPPERALHAVCYWRAVCINQTCIWARTVSHPAGAS